mmetsp:Transcript_58333/g.132105  ORF Transcript_58333/g.132105 Transcript_58333/m.132105 type:complete len:440 (+) Transcript_58333:19-1338(+)
MPRTTRASAEVDLGSFGGASDNEETAAPLTWRLSPTVSLSDWEIRVKRKGSSAKPKSYHCHRNILGVGPRGCTYFVKLFKPQTFAEGGAAASELTLEDTAAAAFPAFLDYVYTGDLSIDTASAVALLDLSNYLRCQAAFAEVQDFLRGDLCAATSVLYIKEASKYAADKVLTAALKLCAGCFEEVSLASLLTLPPDLFVGLVGGPGLKCASKLLSDRVAAYLKAHRTEASADLVTALTPCKLMPVVTPTAAMSLLELGIEHGVLDVQDGGEASGDGATQPPANKKQKARAKRKPPASKTKTLRARCFEALHSDFEALRGSNLDALPPDVTIALLKGGLDSATEAYRAKCDDLETCEDDLEGASSEAADLKEDLSTKERSHTSTQNLLRYERAQHVQHARSNEVLRQKHEALQRDPRLQLPHQPLYAIRGGLFIQVWSGH